MNWFEIDKAGLASILERRGKSWAVLELLQNAWDQDVTTVDVTLGRPRGSRSVVVRVQDDDPRGFENLNHAFTLFAPSAKQANPRQRGRFNLGEKLVLALCSEALITTTRGSVRFDRSGRRRTRAKTATGSIFEGRLAMTAAELDAAIDTLKRALPPAGVDTRLNGEILPLRTPFSIATAKLPTEVAGADGCLTRRERRTELRLHRPLEGESAMLYEMGIPVMRTGDGYHVDVQQKIPLSMDRDGVSPAYLRAVRTSVLNATYEELDEESASSAWVREALGDRRCEPAVVRKAVEARFGRRAVSFDPTDREASHRAVSEGYTVVHGGHLAKEEWANVRAAKALLPAGQVMPTAKVFSDDPNAPPLRECAPHTWSEAECARVRSIQRVARALIGETVRVTIADDSRWQFEAAYGDRHMTLNRAALGREWFEGPMNERVLSLVLHELGHHFAADHLSGDYHRALCRLGARLGLTGPWGATA